MKIKIKDKIYDASKEPIMVILSDYDKENIKNMPKEAKKYCEYPKGYSEEFIRKWMKED